MTDESLQDTVMGALDEMKARDVIVMDVRDLTSIADSMVIASGTSDRHVRSIAENVIETCKESGHAPLGVEGLKDGEWVLVDLQDIILHLMLPRVRDFYNLEKLWTSPARPGRAKAEA
jgi:ribosome-associated protein